MSVEALIVLLRRLSVLSTKFRDWPYILNSYILIYILILAEVTV